MYAMATGVTKNTMNLMTVATGEINLFFFFFSLILLTFFSVIVFKRNSTKGPPIPPGPYPWPIVGNMFQLGKLPHVTITGLAKRHGPLMSVRLGARLLIVGSSPPAAREILKTRDRFLSGRFVRHEFKVEGSKMHNLTIGVADECDDQWKSLRSITRAEVFSAKAIEYQVTHRERTIAEMVRYLRANEGSVVEIGEMAFVVSLNILSNAIFSMKFVDFDGKGVGAEMRNLIRTLGDAKLIILDLFPVLGKWFPQSMNKKFKGIFEGTYATWEDILKERRKQRDNISNRDDFLETLIKLGLSDFEINPFILEMFNAGTDSTTSTVTWAVAELLKNQEAMQKLRDELEKETGQDIIRDSNLPRLPYLEACFKETLRLHPPAPLLLPHRALQTCEVMGYTIPKDAIVATNVWAIGRDPTIWNDPLSFRPERFLTSGMDYMGSDFEYLPFGSGRRMCPGQPLGSRVVPLILGNLIHLFDWSLPGGIDPAELDMKEKHSITLLKEQPLYAVPKLRKQLKD